MEAIIAKLNTLSIDQLVEIVSTLNGRFDSESEIVFDAALNMLESKMETSDFVRFCNKL